MDLEVILYFHNYLNGKHYKLSPCDIIPGQYFLSTEEGEGMQISGHKLFEMIDKYFKENM